MSWKKDQWSLVHSPLLSQEEDQVMSNYHAKIKPKYLKLLDRIDRDELKDEVSLISSKSNFQNVENMYSKTTSLGVLSFQSKRPTKIHLKQIGAISASNQTLGLSPLYFSTSFLFWWTNRIPRYFCTSSGVRCTAP